MAGGTHRERRAHPAPVLVRIVLDPTVEDRRIAAFQDLEGEHREEALAGLADEHFRRLLEALD